MFTHTKIQIYNHNSMQISTLRRLQLRASTRAFTWRASTARESKPSLLTRERRGLVSIRPEPSISATGAGHGSKPSGAGAARGALEGAVTDGAAALVVVQVAGRGIGEARGASGVTVGVEMRVLVVVVMVVVVVVVVVAFSSVSIQLAEFWGQNPNPRISLSVG